MTLHSLIEFIKYRLKAKTRHGIHSPFVYAFIDNCLGMQSHLSLKERINNYFGNAIKWPDEEYNVSLGNSLFVLGIEDIHTNKEHQKLWHTLIKDAPFVLSIDLYSIGLLVHNPDIKEKQHFVLKYPL